MKNYYTAYAEINLTNLVENYEIIKTITKNSNVMSVVKADAYGHGAVKCSQALYEAGCTYFGAANYSEAVEIRKATGKDAVVLILGYTPPEAADLLIENDITQTVFSNEYAEALSDNISLGRLKTHLKIDTGMNRLGFKDYKQAEAACLIPKLDFRGIFTHFACGDEPEKSMTSEQFKKFNSILEYLKSRGIEFETRHAAASTSILNFPETYLDMVRAGIILYGLQPSDAMPSVTEKYGFKRVMSLKTQVSFVHEVEKGETVSYGAAFTADRKMRLATLPLGYADGFIRSYSKGAIVKINDSIVPIVGRICMDQCMADISGLDIKRGDPVEVFGNSVFTEYYANLANTIPYETVCLVGKRVPRCYIV